MAEGLRILLIMLGVLIAARIVLPHVLQWLSGYLALMTVAVILALIILAAVLGAIPIISRGDDFRDIGLLR